MLPRWVKPRLGEARPQYRPRPLRVPRRYRRTTPPDPAPTISLVTPTLNQGRYVDATIRSVLSQEYPALQYVVMDGGSSDGSAELVSGYRDRLHHFESGPDAGQGAAINGGFDRTDGEIMGWLNSDDLLLPGSLAYVADFFDANPDVQMIYGHRVLIDEAGRDIGLWVTPPHSPDLLRWFDYLPQESAFWRRSLWKTAGGIDESIDVAFDWDLFLRFQAEGARMRRVSRFLGAFRLHPEQRTRIHDERAQRELAEIRRCWHGRDVDLDEARSRVDGVRLRSLPHYARHRLAHAVPVLRKPVHV
jgi:glycosyltransferase involved in cell wall biosynthesis